MNLTLTIALDHETRAILCSLVDALQSIPDTPAVIPPAGVAQPRAAQVPAPVLPESKPYSPQRERTWTPERNAVLYELWDTDTPFPEIRAKLDALPGYPITTDNAVWRRANKLHLRRPPKPSKPKPEPKKVGPTTRTPERRDLMVQIYETDIEAVELRERINALPGPFISGDQIRTWGCDLGLRRPKKPKREKPPKPIPPKAAKPTSTWPIVATIRGDVAEATWAEVAAFAGGQSIPFTTIDDLAMVNRRRGERGEKPFKLVVR